MSEKLQCAAALAAESAALTKHLAGRDEEIAMLTEGTRKLEHTPGKKHQKQRSAVLE